MSNYLEDGYHREAAAYAPENARVGFIRRTYLHLAVSVAALVGIEALLLQGTAGADVLKAIYGSKMSLLIRPGPLYRRRVPGQVHGSGGLGPRVKYLGLALYIAIWKR